MLKRLLAVIILVPLAIALIWLAVTNRAPVTVNIPPDIQGTPFYSFSLPLYWLVFGCLGLGAVLGSFTTWMKQGKHRKAARARKTEATKWHFEADKEKERANDLAKEMADLQANANNALPAPSKVA